MTLPAKKTPAVASLERSIFLIYGDPGVGKSTLCSHSGKALYVATEPGLNHLEVYQVPCPTIKEVGDVYLDLKKNPEHGFGPIVIDTLDRLYELCLERVCQKLTEKYGVEVTVGDDEAWSKGNGWSLSKTMLVRSVMSFAQLGVGLWLVAHKRVDTVKTRTGDFDFETFALPPSTNREIANLCDVILRIEVDSEGERRVLTKPNKHYHAKDRTAHGMPEELPLDYDAICAAYEAAQAPVKTTKKEKAA